MDVRDRVIAKESIVKFGTKSYTHFLSYTVLHEYCYCFFSTRTKNHMPQDVWRVLALFPFSTWKAPFEI